MAAHAHQPLRVRPGTSLIERQTGPGLDGGWHDYNQLIGRQCYEPCGFAGLDGADGFEVKLINLYRYLSLGSSEHLLEWMERHSPFAYRCWLAGHAYNLKTFGHSNMLCEPNDHAILTTLTPRQVQRQLRWGRRGYGERLGVNPVGMWASEGCINLDVLKAAFDEGFEFTVVRFHQIGAWRLPDEEEWRWTDPNHRYIHEVHLGGNDYFVLFDYDYVVSTQMCRDKLLDCGRNAYLRMKHAFEGESEEPQFIFTHWDLETLGHHWHKAEKGCAECIQLLLADPDLQFSNLAAFHAAYKELRRKGAKFRQAKLRPGATSWSCFCLKMNDGNDDYARDGDGQIFHEGDARWTRHCMHTERGSGRSQHWRTNLKKVTDLGCTMAQRLYEQHGPAIFRDLVKAEDDYKLVVLEDLSPQAIDRYFAEHGQAELTWLQRRNGIRLQEILRWTHAAKTSCGWFFDELSGPEGVKNLRCLMHAIQLMRAFGVELEAEVVAELAKAVSNIPKYSNGAGVWEQLVINAPEPDGISTLQLELERILDELAEFPELWLVRRLKALLGEFRIDDPSRNISRHIELDRWRVKNRVLLIYADALAAGHLTPNPETNGQMHAAFAELAAPLGFLPEQLGWEP